jgi:soluble lytic murein transglycosylase
MTSPASADPAALRAAQDLARAGQWDAALRAAGSDLARDIIDWQRLRASEGLLGEYEAFVQRRPDWPGLPLLREKGEEAVARSDTPARVITWFNGTAPQTGEGAVALVRALRAEGRVAEAEQVAMTAWMNLSFTTAEEEALLSMAGDSLAAVHEARLDRLLWDGSRVEAGRMLPRVSAGWQALAKARMALRADTEGVNALIEAVPAALANDPGLANERFIWRMRRERYDDALPLILERSTSPAALGDPAAWAQRRVTLSRWLMRQGRPAEAYRVATSHYLTGGAAWADLEFLAGFLALRRMNDPARALDHFRALEAGVSTPISLSRAQYWQGRAQEALGQTEAAHDSYRRAALHQTAYYGLLAAEKLGQELDTALLSDARAPDWRQAAWTRSSVHEAALLLLRAGDMAQARRFWLHLAESLDATGLAQMGDMALALDQPNLAVLVGKAAAERGVILPRAYYPMTDMVPDGLAVSRAFAKAIARRESEFDPTARSQADARGLMQVLPGTAQMVAPKIGLPFEAARLTRDPAYNVKIGSQYLADLVAEFGPSIALVASGYNAGPGRPRRWITEFGDPRLPEVDVVDWVESIPFSETRTYVMRVVEGVVIYRAKLRGSTGPVRVTAELKG